MNRLIHILEVLHPEVDFFREERLVEGGILDSFDIVTIVAEVDGTYGVTIPPEELTPENFYSAQTLYALISSLL